VHLELSSLQGTMKVVARAQLVYRALAVQRERTQPGPTVSRDG
jgi:hypothetical protein